MSIFKNKFFRYLRKKRVLIPVVILVVIAALVAFSPKRKPSYETAKVTRSNVVEQVSVTGKVVAAQDLNLAFEKVGTISSVYVRPGDHVAKGQLLGELSAGDLTAAYDQANAALMADQAKYEETLRGTRAEDLAVEKSKYQAAIVAYDGERKDFLDSLFDVYAKTADAVRTKTDQYFSYPETQSQSFNLQADPNAGVEVNNYRRKTGALLVELKATLDHSSTAADLAGYATIAQNLIDTSTTYLQKLAAVAVALGNDDYKSNVLAALAEVNTARSSFAASYSALRNSQTSLDLAKRQLDVKQAGSSSQEKDAAAALVAQARANLSGAQAALEKTRLRSPIDGLVTQAVPKVGEIFSSGKTAFRIISDGQFQMDTFIPEADIAKVKVGDIASVTLDAYGSDATFDASVTAIEPAETIVENVPTYKATLVFKNKDERIRSGMTANIDITTNTRENALTVPYRAVVSGSGKKKVVRVIAPDGVALREVPVTTGIRGVDGEVEISGDVAEGETVVTYVNK